jgi:hypothetical protein
MRSREQNSIDNLLRTIQILECEKYVLRFEVGEDAEAKVDELIRITYDRISELNAMKELK